MLLELTSTSERSATMRLHARHDEITPASPERRPRIAAWFDWPVIGLHHGRTWLVAPAERDPLKTPDGRYVIPTRPLAELRRLSARGVQFDQIAIAHELNQEGLVRHLIPLLKHGPRTCTDEVARQLVGPVPPHPRVAQLADLMDRFAGGIVRVAKAGSATADRIAAFVHDPIVFGVVGCRGAPAAGEAALWYPLTAWEW
jgi:hypothetical protein